jgi:DNA-directed RNA polymerase subunit RPC12/RpoP
VKCSKCGLDKPVEDFDKSKSSKSGYAYWCKTCSRQANKNWKLNNPEQAKESEARRKRKSRYNLDAEDYTAMMLEQDNKCAICKRPFGEGNTPRIDHKHDENLDVRGLLCHNCNAGLGYFRDDIESLLKAIEYLKK